MPYLQREITYVTVWFPWWTALPKWGALGRENFFSWESKFCNISFPFNHLSIYWEILFEFGMCIGLGKSSLTIINGQIYLQSYCSYQSGFRSVSAWGLIHIWYHGKIYIKSKLKGIFLNLATNDQSDKSFLLWSKILLLGVICPNTRQDTECIFVLVLQPVIKGTITL